MYNMLLHLYTYMITKCKFYITKILSEIGLYNDKPKKYSRAPVTNKEIVNTNITFCKKS